MTREERRQDKLKRVLFVLKLYLEKKMKPKKISRKIYGTTKKAWKVWEIIRSACE